MIKIICPKCNGDMFVESEREVNIYRIEYIIYCGNCAYQTKYETRYDEGFLITKGGDDNV